VERLCHKVFKYYIFAKEIGRDVNNKNNKKTSIDLKKREELAVVNCWLGKQLLSPAMDTHTSQKKQKAF
jgi:hypothetical protein